MFSSRRYSLPESDRDGCYVNLILQTLETNTEVVTPELNHNQNDIFSPEDNGRFAQRGDERLTRVGHQRGLFDAMSWRCWRSSVVPFGLVCSTATAQNLSRRYFEGQLCINTPQNIR